jgi:hypothetical protein
MRSTRRCRSITVVMDMEDITDITADHVDLVRILNHRINEKLR